MPPCRRAQAASPLAGLGEGMWGGWDRCALQDSWLPGLSVHLSMEQQLKMKNPVPPRLEAPGSTLPGQGGVSLRAAATWDRACLVFLFQHEDAGGPGL